eukprot:TRINITY_DN12914_c0_g1_i3.p2 TRINITY_DN12914_c0_g1~~TRINITY_DN12914_c0_g1_i3.p2  ORF type:complete len:164 (+),score=25.07 TRINITY_DN12914_c0_g1_i3:81-572(+)
MMKTCLLLSTLVSTLGMQLKVDATNPCIATGNGTKFDISDLFDYPIKATKGYEYTFNPCVPIPCAGESNDAAICQAADFPRAGGNVHDAIWFLDSYQPWQFRILFPNGFNWRATWVTFTEDPDSEKGKFEALGEYPYEIYNFNITHKNVKPVWAADWVLAMRK